MKVKCVIDLKISKILIKFIFFWKFSKYISWEKLIFVCSMWYKLPQEMWEIHAQFMWCQSKDVGGGSEWGQEGAICQSTKTRHNYGK